MSEGQPIPIEDLLDGLEQALEERRTDKRLDGSVLDGLQQAFEVTRMNNRIDAMWNPSLVDPEIHLEDPELDEFLETFQQDDRGRKIQTWVERGSRCESQLEESCRGQNRAVGSIDFHGGTTDDSVLVCRNDIRPVYHDIMDKAVRLGGISPDVTINGKPVPVKTQQV